MNDLRAIRRTCELILTVLLVVVAVVAVAHLVRASDHAHEAEQHLRRCPPICR